MSRVSCHAECEVMACNYIRVTMSCVLGINERGTRGRLKDDNKPISLNCCCCFFSPCHQVTLMAMPITDQLLTINIKFLTLRNFSVFNIWSKSIFNFC